MIATLLPILFHLVILSIFYGCYRLLLSRETFFTFNRLFLLFGLVASVVLPFFKWEFSSGMMEEQLPFDPEWLEVQVTEINKLSDSTDALSWWPVLQGIYWAVSLLLLLRWLFQLYQVFSEARRKGITKVDGVRMVNTDRYPGPFAFFNLLFINSSSFMGEELHRVILHEKAHIQQHHWIDLSLIQIVRIVFWVNPVLYWFEKGIKQNHEFLADEVVLSSGTNRSQYQTMVLHQLMGAPASVPGSHLFNYNNHKKRFQMMNQKRSRPIRRLKVLFILPFLTIALWAFGQDFANNTTELQAETNEQTFNEAEEITVKGKVIDAKKETPLIGTAILIVGKKEGTITDLNGEFEIKMEKGATLQFKYIGYEEQTVKVTDDSPLEIKMKAK